MTRRQQHAYFRFYAELNDFLLPQRRGRTLLWRFQVPGSVKDAIESLGPPHTEVELVVANGVPVGFDYRIRPGDRIAAYPRFRRLDVSTVSRVGRAPLAEPRFVLDTHLGRLAVYLRMLGFDAAYRNDFSDEDLAAASSREQRILLTRDLGLLKRREVVYGYYLRETAPRRQLFELAGRYGLGAFAVPFRRCLRCNCELQPVEKGRVADRLPAGVRERHADFRLCPDCGRVYWKGSHYRRMQKLIAKIEGLKEHSG